MRRGTLLLIIAVMMAVLLGILGCGSASTVLPAAGEGSPEAILDAAITGSQEMTSASGSFDLTMAYDIDTTGLPEEALAYFEEPMTVSGAFATGTQPQTADLSLTLAMGGEAIDVGIKLIDDKMWICMLDQWYETPPDVELSMAEAGFDEAQIQEMLTLVEELGVEPVTWFKDLTLVGEETVEGVAAYHLAGTPDMAKMMADVIGLMESEEFMDLIDPSGALTGSMGEGMAIIDADELQEAQDQISGMFRDLRFDVWVAKDDNTLRKAAMAAHIVPPEGEDAAGMNAIDINMELLLTSVNEPVIVEPPASPLPYEQLEEAMMENPAMFMGPFMGLYGMGMGQSDLAY